MEKKNLLGMNLQELRELVVGMGEPPFRARQIYRAIYNQRQFDFALMTNLSKKFRARLSEECAVEPPQIEQVFRSNDGTKRYLLKLPDGSNVESVYIPDGGRRTICISTQVGCAVGCAFCMTAKLGLKRNLTAGEIVGQVLVVLKGAEECGSRAVNIVLMGMGEPLHNYANTVKALELMTDPEGMAISPRRITLSTSGFVPALQRLVKERVVPNIAVSLSATTDRLRSELIPVNRRWGIEELLETCRQLPLPARRRLTFEYVLLDGVNDSESDARRLARLIREKGLRAKVNLIPFNPDPALRFKTPTPERISAFQRTLLQQNITALVRRPRGLDISAACGQLAARKELN